MDKGAHLPPDLKKAFGTLVDVPVQYIGYVMKVNKAAKRQLRVAILLTECLFVCTLSGEIKRCIRLMDIEGIEINPNDASLLFRVPSEYDLFFSTTEWQTIIREIRSRKPKLPLKEVTASQVNYKRLERPEGLLEADVQIVVPQPALSIESVGEGHLTPASPVHVTTSNPRIPRHEAMPSADIGRSVVDNSSFGEQGTRSSSEFGQTPQQTPVIPPAPVPQPQPIQSPQHVLPPSRTFSQNHNIPPTNNTTTHHQDPVRDLQPSYVSNQQQPIQQQQQQQNSFRRTSVPLSEAIVPRPIPQSGVPGLSQQRSASIISQPPLDPNPELVEEVRRLQAELRVAQETAASYYNSLMEERQQHREAMADVLHEVANMKHALVEADNQRVQLMTLLKTREDEWKWLKDRFLNGTTATGAMSPPRSYSNAFDRQRVSL